MPLNQRERLARQKQLNQLKPCSVPGCQYHRNDISPRCFAHEQMHRRYGAALAKALPRVVISAEQKRVRSFLAKHADTPQVRTAVEVLDRYVRTHGHNAPDLRVRDHLSRLSLEGLTGAELLEKVLTIYSIAHHNSNLIVNDLHHTFLLGRAVLNARKPQQYVTRSGRTKYRKLASTTVRTVGTFVHTALGMFARNMTDAMDNEWKRREQIARTLATPFSYADPPTDPLTVAQALVVLRAVRDKHSRS